MKIPSKRKLPDRLGQALFRACERGSIDTAQKLISGRAAPIDYQDSNKNTPLMAAAWNGHTEIVRLLLQHGADVALINHFGFTAQAQGVEPFDAIKLAAWAKSGKSTAEICAVQFLLSVWNPSEARDDVFGLKYFDLHEAMEVWDRHHQQAFAGWCEEPWRP